MNLSLRKIGSTKERCVSIANSLSGEPRSDHKEALSWKVTEKASHIAAMNLLALPVALVFGTFFFMFARMIGKAQTLTWTVTETLIFLIGSIMVIALHEFVHAVAMQSLGAKPKYGFWGRGLMFYAKAPGHAFKRNQYVFILLSPLVGLSVLACSGIVIQPGSSIVWLLAIWGIVNASAASGDLWIAAIVLRYPSYAIVVDERDGMRILLPQSDMQAE